MPARCGRAPSATDADQQAVDARAGRRRGAGAARRAAGAIATPSRTGRAPRRSTGARRARARRSSAGIATIRPPSRRTAFSPSSRPSRSTSGPPPDPRGRGAVCSMQPAMRAAARAADARDPPRTRSPASRAARARRGSPSAITAVPMPAPRRGRVPLHGLDVAGVDCDRGEVQVRVDAATRPGSRRAAGQVHGDLLAAQVVGGREDPAGSDDDAAAASPAAAEADHRRADALHRRSIVA